MTQEREQHDLVVVSGYFNPLHAGHLDMIAAARSMGKGLVVIVNNDHQQVLKKGKIITPLNARLAVVAALRQVDLAVAAIDEDGSVQSTLEALANMLPHRRLCFANGGDRRDAAGISEAEACQRLGIELAFGVGGDEKRDSSSRINAELGIQPLPES